MKNQIVIKLYFNVGLSLMTVSCENLRITAKYRLLREENKSVFKSDLIICCKIIWLLSKYSCKQIV